MLATLISTRLRHTSMGVLVAWLCVCMASAWAPMVRAQSSHQHAVHLCSGEMAPLDAPNPMAAADQGMALHHVLDCPLCLPVLAPPPHEVLAPCSLVVPTFQIPAVRMAHLPPRVALPPARAPPVKA